MQHLALATETRFLVDPERRTIEYWWQEICQKRISLDALRQYAADERWHKRRQSFWRGVQANYLRQHHMRLVQSRLGELQDAVDIRDFVARQSRPVRGAGGVEMVPFKVTSYEGLLRALVQVDSMVEAKRDAILDSIEPMLSAVEEQAETGTSALPFEPKEMRELAHGLLRKRQARRLAEQGITTDDDDDDDDDGDIIDVESDEADGPPDEAESS